MTKTKDKEFDLGSIYIIQQITTNREWEDTTVKSKVIGIIEAALNVIRKENKENNAINEYRVIVQTRKVIDEYKKDKVK